MMITINNLVDRVNILEDTRNVPEVKTNDIIYSNGIAITLRERVKMLEK
jgi:hypothetical protein